MSRLFSGIPPRILTGNASKEESCYLSGTLTVVARTLLRVPQSQSEVNGAKEDEDSRCEAEESGAEDVLKTRKQADARVVAESVNGKVNTREEFPSMAPFLILW